MAGGILSTTRFVHLHNHSEYSLLDGAQRIGDMIERAKKLDKIGRASCRERV